jgi:hypothetical protein
VVIMSTEEHDLDDVIASEEEEMARRYKKVGQDAVMAQLSEPPEVVEIDEPVEPQPEGSTVSAPKVKRPRVRRAAAAVAEEITPEDLPVASAATPLVMEKVAVVRAQPNKAVPNPIVKMQVEAVVTARLQYGAVKIALVEGQKILVPREAGHWLIKSGRAKPCPQF